MSYHKNQKSLVNFFNEGNTTFRDAYRSVSERMSSAKILSSTARPVLPAQPLDMPRRYQQMNIATCVSYQPIPTSQLGALNRRPYRGASVAMKDIKPFRTFQGLKEPAVRRTIWEEMEKRGMTEG